MTSLHTKYRPGRFEDVVGQSDTTKSLKRVASDGRAKVFLFTGPPGTGKTTLARILANIFAGGKATAANIDERDAATESGVDAARDMAVRAQYRAVGASPVKVMILDEAHRLSAAAWTALLKPIEHPPEHVYWVFCTTDPGKVPKAILTRCLRYDLKPVNEDLILKLLVKVCDAEGFDTGDEILEAIANDCGGSPRQALVFLEECLYCETAGEARRIMRSAGQSKGVIDLCRFLMKGQGQSWAEAMKLCKALEETEAEGVRIVVCNYLSKALADAKGENQAKAILGILECFLKPYNTSDKMAPLLYSVGQAILI